jgi:HlyD family secretion protein
MTATADIVVKEVNEALLVPSAALRFAPAVIGDETEAKGNLLSRIMPRPPRQNNQQKANADQQQSVWVLEEGKLRQLHVTTGVSSGTQTQILSGDLSAGMEVVTDSVINGQ